MRIFGRSIEIQRILYLHKYGYWHFEHEFYFGQFLNLKQENLTIDKYTRQFQELQVKCELEEKEIHDFVHYIGGLQPNILENMIYCQTSEEAYLEAFRVERMLRRSHMQQSQFQIHVEH